jgi:hypothetical protein
MQVNINVGDQLILVLMYVISELKAIKGKKFSFFTPIGENFEFFKGNKAKFLFFYFDICNRK